MIAPSRETESSLDAQIDAIHQTFESASQLLRTIDRSADVNADTPPYHASVGGHLRHVLDVFDAVLRGIPSQTANLSRRARDTNVETQPTFALQRLDQIRKGLNALRDLPKNAPIVVADDLGDGIHALPYTLSALLYQAQSHAIHHFACIGYILAFQGIALPIEGFGYNPTSPR